MKVKKLLRLAILLSFTAGNSFTAIAEGGEDPTECGCQTNSINISTGFSPVTLSPLSPGDSEPSWQLIHTPAGSQVNGTLQNPATPFVINNGGSTWGQNTPALKALLIADASYISPINSHTYQVNNPTDPFIFRLNFCVCSEDNYLIEGLLNADDWGALYLDNNPTPIQICNGWGDVENVSASVNLSQGSHFLELHLKNTGAQSMGIALSGNITSSGGLTSLIGRNCCNPAGGINGLKYLDENCNGVIDANDPVAQGWTFVLNPGNLVVTTDATGSFSFAGLAPGTYTLSEVAQPGWNSILPNTAGTVTLLVDTGEVTTVNFLNSACDEIGCEKECYWRITGNNTIDDQNNYLGTNTDAHLIIKTDGIERARIEGHGDGNMGIATNSPTTIFHTYAAPPHEGAPSGVRLEDLPWGEGNILVVDDDGYVYRSESGWALKKGESSSTGIMDMQQEMNALKKEILELKSLLRGSEENNLTVSPNPTDGRMTATFRIARPYESAKVIIVDNTGKMILSNNVSGYEGTTGFVIPQAVTSGNIMCTLIVDGKAMATQKVVLLNK